ncbi:MAG: hypothetical protein ABIH36_00590 [bacterium]
MAKNKIQQNNSEDVFAKIAKDRVLRRRIAYESHQMFFTIYFPNYLKYPLAQFQKEIIRLTEDDSQELVCIAGFRGCAKSTFGTLSYPLWSILGAQQKKFVLITAQTYDKARGHMANIKDALENNQLLKSDMGPFKEESGNGEWAISSLVFCNTGARIMIASVDQSVRGVRHREHRPDIIILDDVEDTLSVRTFEGRKKIADWYSRELVPLGDAGTRIIILANVLHYDSLILRLKRKIDDGEMDGIYRFYPIVDKYGKPLWREKFDTPEKINVLRRKVGDEMAWQQEYLLEIASDDSQAINPKWIKYYDKKLPPLSDNISERIFAAVDLAISKNNNADCTAIVKANVRYDRNDHPTIYIQPHPINKRMQFPDTISRLKLIIPTLGEGGRLFIETTGFQEAYLQQLIQDGYKNIESVKPLTDKDMRLAAISPFVQDATVLFPRHGCEQLIAQITNPSIERHDDLADAFSMLIQQIVEKYYYVPRFLMSTDKQPGFFTLSSDKPFFPRDMVF